MEIVPRTQLQGAGKKIPIRGTSQPVSKNGGQFYCYVFLFGIPCTTDRILICHTTA